MVGKPQAEIFAEIKKNFVQYPECLPAFRRSAGHYFPSLLHQFFTEQLTKLPPDSIYLELGSFLGAGSTLLAMQANLTLRAICVDNFKPIKVSKDKYRPENVQDSDYACNKGTPLDHFFINTFPYADRIAVIQTTIDRSVLDKLAETGIRPSVILIDDDHHFQPLLIRLDAIRTYWPDALVVVDDYCKSWPGVVRGVNKALKNGWYNRACTRQFDRLFVFNYKE